MKKIENMKLINICKEISSLTETTFNLIRIHMNQLILDKRIWFKFNNIHKSLNDLCETILDNENCANNEIISLKNEIKNGR